MAKQKIPISLQKRIQDYQIRIYKMMLPTFNGNTIKFQLIHYNIEHVNNFEMVGYKDGKIIPAYTPGCEPWILSTLIIAYNNGGLEESAGHKKAFLPVAWRDEVLIDFERFLAGEKKLIVYRPDQLVQIRIEFLMWFDQDGDNL